MTELESALVEVVSVLEVCAIPHMLIGGLAVTAWGEARSTLDVDVSVWTDSDRLAEAVSCICKSMRAQPADPLQFVLHTRVLPLESAGGVRIDVVFGAFPVQQIAISRAVQKKIAGLMIPVASIEDMLMMKLVSEREKDLADARGLIRRFGKTIDREYLMPKLQELAVALDRPEIATALG